MTTIHASAVLIGSRAVLVRGPAGSGKSLFVLAAIEAAAVGLVPFARLVADDRAELTARHGRLLVSPPAALAGLIEVRGVGIRSLPYEPAAVVGRVVDLDDEGAERLPDQHARIAVEGVDLRYLKVPRGVRPLPLLLAAMGTVGVER